MNIGKNKTPIVDTWWQTETGGIMISSLAGCNKSKTTFATKPIPGIRPVLLNNQGHEIKEKEAEGILAIKFPWPGIAEQFMEIIQDIRSLFHCIRRLLFSW